MPQELDESENNSTNNYGKVGVLITKGGKAWIEKIIFTIAFPFNKQHQRFAQFVAVTIYITLILAGFKRLSECGYADFLTYLFWIIGNILLSLTGIYYMVFWDPDPPKVSGIREYAEFKVDTTQKNYEEQARAAFNAIDHDKRQRGEELKKLKTFEKRRRVLRFLAAFGAISVLLFTFSGYQIWKVFDVDGKTILALAKYADSQSEPLNSDTGFISRELKISTKLKNDDEKDIKLKDINKSFLEGQRESLIDEGNRRNAAIAIWGWYNQYKIYSYFELLKPPPEFPNIKNDECIDNNVLCLIHDQPIAEVSIKFKDKLTIQEKKEKTDHEISSEMSYLTLFTLGLTYYKDGLKLGLSHYKDGSKAKEHFEIAKKSLDRAVDRFTKALDKLKDFKEPKSNLEVSFAEFYRGNSLFYQALFSKSGLLYDSAIENYTRVIELNPEHISTHNSWENYYSSGGSYSAVPVSYTSYSQSIAPNEANNWQEKICANRKRDSHILINDSPSQIRVYLARVYYNRGVAYAMKGDTDRALADYENALRLDPEIDEVCIGLGIAYSEKGNYSPAIKNYERAISVDSQDKIAYNNLGNVYAIQGNYEQAILQYEQAIRLDPSFAEAYYNRGQAQFVWKKDRSKEKSENDFVKALELEPNFSELYYYGRGKGYLEKREYVQAVDNFKKAIEFKQDFAEAYYGMGEAYLNGSYYEAIESFKKAIEFKQDFAEAYYGMGEAYSNKSSYEEAIKSFRKAVELKPGFSSELKPKIAEAYAKLGERFLSDGRSSAASKSFKEAIKLNPEFSDELKPKIAEADRQLGESMKHQAVATLNQESQQDLSNSVVIKFQNLTGRNTRVTIFSVDGSQAEQLSINSGETSPVPVRLKSGKYNVRTEVTDSGEPIRYEEKEFNFEANKPEPIKLELHRQAF